MLTKYTLSLFLTLASIPGWAQTGNISTIAGNGTVTSGGDGGLAASCGVAMPYHMICAANGDVYISEMTGQRIRKIDAATGNVSLFASGSLFKTPSGMTFDPDGNVIVADKFRFRIIKITPAGVVTNITNGGEGISADGTTGYMARWMMPADVAYDAAGNLYVVDEQDHRVRKINTTGHLETVAGTGADGLSGDGGPATAAQLSFPTAVDVDANGYIYIADNGNHRIRRISPGGTISTIAGTTGGYAGDGGPALAAKLFNPNDVMVSGDRLFIADMNNNRVRMIDAAGIITTVAGNGTPGFGGDGGSALSAQLFYPTMVARDAGGNLLIADMNNNRVRKVSGVVAVHNVAQSTMISVYPNPASEVVHIDVPVNTYRSVSLLNSTGGLVLQQEIKGPQTELNIATLPSGIYSAILHGDEYVTMKKIVKL